MNTFYFLVAVSFGYLVGHDFYNLHFLSCRLSGMEDKCKSLEDKVCVLTTYVCNWRDKKSLSDR